MTRSHLAALGLALAFAGGGCASMRAQQRRTERLGKELDALRYARPMDDVWDAVRRLLSERGYPLAAADAKAIGAPEPGVAGRLFSPSRATSPLGDLELLQMLGVTARPAGRTLETGWGSAADRYRADAFQEPDGVRVVLTRLVQESVEGSRSGSRDLELELELARRLDPETAARIAAAVAPEAPR